jgi:hypothetical protein
MSNPTVAAVALEALVQWQFQSLILINRHLTSGSAERRRRTIVLSVGAGRELYAAAREP